MGYVGNTIVSLIASAVSRANRKKVLKRVERENADARNVINMGMVGADHLLPEWEESKNICVSGGDAPSRRDLTLQCCRQTAANMAVIILHEGDRELERDLYMEFQHHHYLRIMNGTASFYEPVLRLQDDEMARLLSAASEGIRPIGAAGEAYLKFLAKLLRKKGITPYIRMLTSCPHGNLQQIILQAEQNGNIADDEAALLRKELSLAEQNQVEVASFLSALQAETEPLAWKRDLARSSSLAECVRAGGILSVDIQTSSKPLQMALLAAEVKECIRLNRPFRVILSVSSLGNVRLWEELLQQRNPFFHWMLSVSDLQSLTAQGRAQLPDWIALSHKLVLFSHGIPSAEQFSSLLGEYEYADVAFSHTGSNNIGVFGYHFGANQTVNISKRKKRVVDAQEIITLEDKEFFMLDNHTAFLGKGTLI